MFGLPARLILTVTALAPVLFTYGWSVWSSDKNLAYFLGVGSFLLVSVCMWLILQAENNLEEVSIEVMSAEAADNENVAFLLLYLSPFFAESFSSVNWSVIAPAIFVFGLVICTGYNYHYSPMLGLLRWHSYRVSSKEGITYVLLTRRQLRKASGRLTVRQLTEYVVIEFERR